MDALSNNNPGDKFRTSDQLSTGRGVLQKLLYVEGVETVRAGPMVSRGLSG